MHPSVGRLAPNLGEVCTELSLHRIWGRLAPNCFGGWCTELVHRIVPSLRKQEHRRITLGGPGLWQPLANFVHPSCCTDLPNSLQTYPPFGADLSQIPCRPLPHSKQSQPPPNSLLFSPKFGADLRNFHIPKTESQNRVGELCRYESKSNDN